jgi:hypothetical protein
VIPTLAPSGNVDQCGYPTTWASISDFNHYTTQLQITAPKRMMGQSLSVYDSPTMDLKPGTYRIVNVASKTVVEAPDSDRRKVTAGTSLAINDKHKMVGTINLYTAIDTDSNFENLKHIVVCTASG